jgi:hypothetical protein
MRIENGLMEIKGERSRPLAPSSTVAHERAEVATDTAFRDEVVRAPTMSHFPAPRRHPSAIRRDACAHPALICRAETPRPQRGRSGPQGMTLGLPKTRTSPRASRDGKSRCGAAQRSVTTSSCESRGWPAQRRYGRPERSHEIGATHEGSRRR